MQALTLRTEVEPRDRARIAEITAATDMFHGAEIDVAVALVDDRLAKGRVSGYQFLFVDEGDETQGYAIYGFNSRTRSSWDLHWIAVHPECHGTGIGRLLITEVETRARAGGCTHLWVDTAGRDNYKPTRAFYLAMGYTIAGELKDFYAPGDSKIVFVKALHESPRS